MKKTTIPHNPSTGFFLLLLAGFNVYRIIRHQNSTILPLFIVALIVMIVMMIIHFSTPYAIFENDQMIINHNYFSKKTTMWNDISNIDRIGNKISIKTSNSTYINVNLRNMSKNDRERFLKIFNQNTSDQENI